MVKHIKQKCILAGLFVWLFTSASLVAQPNDWQPRGMGGGGALFSPSISPHNANEIFVACDMTDLFRTTNLGAAWEVVPFNRIRAYPETRVQFSSDPQVLYAIHFDFKTDQRIAVKSRDGGATWQTLADDPTSGEAYYLYADPGGTDRIILTSYGQIFFSANGGASFSSIYSNNENDGAYVSGLFWDGSNIYVGVARGVLTSANGGASFTLNKYSGIPSSEGMSSFTGAKQNNVTRFFCVTLNLADIYPTVTGAEHWGFKGVYMLDGSGPQTWSRRTNGLSSEDHPFFVATSPNNIDTAYLAGGNGDTSYPIIYKTQNGGSSWNKVFRAINNENIRTGWSGYRGDKDWWYGEFALGFAVSPTNPDVAVLTDLGFVHITTDGGTTWRQAYVGQADENAPGAPTPKGNSYRSIGLENTSVWWLTWLDRDNIFASFTDVTAIRSTDGGQSWSRNYTGLDFNSVYHAVAHPATGTLYAATSSVHDLYQSTYLQDSDIDDGTGAIMYSTDFGQTWQTLQDFGHPVIWLALDPNDSNTMYASVVHGSAGGIYRTRNLQNGSSSSWVRLAAPPGTHGHPLNIHILKDGTLVCSYSGWRDSGGSFTNSSGVFVSADVGGSWIDRSNPGMRYWSKDLIIDPHDGNQNTWYVCVFSGWGGAANGLGGLYKTTDRGSNWQRISDLDRVESCTVDPQNPDIVYLTTEADGLWYSNNFTAAAPAFAQVESYPFQHPMRVFFNPFDSDEVWITSFGNGLRVGKQNPMSVRNAPGVPDDFQMAINPNPASGHANVNLTLAKSQNVEIKLYNVLGQQIRLLRKSGWLNAGQHDFQLNLTDFPNGLYLLQVRHGQQFKTRKLTIIR